MHDAALDFYREELKRLPPLDVLELGSRIVYGTACVRDVYPLYTSWFGIDIADGLGVDRVADAATFTTDRRFDIVICAEVFEHTPEWPKIIDNAHIHLKEGGLFLASCARDARPPHSAVDGGPLRDGEYYRNVSAAEVEAHITRMGWRYFDVREADGYFAGDDLYLKACK